MLAVKQATQMQRLHRARLGCVRVSAAYGGAAVLAVMAATCARTTSVRVLGVANRPCGAAWWRDAEAARGCGQLQTCYVIFFGLLCAPEK